MSLTFDVDIDMQERVRQPSCRIGQAIWTVKGLGLPAQMGKRKKLVCNANELYELKIADLLAWRH